MLNIVMLSLVTILGCLSRASKTAKKAVLACSQNVFWRVKFVAGILHPDERFRVVEPTPGLDLVSMVFNFFFFDRDDKT